MPTFNPPPNWPAPPTGWVPPAGWQPDPAWGPPPVGWPLWLPDELGGRPNRNAFLRVGVLAGVTYLALVVVLLTTGPASPYGMGVIMGRLLFPWLIASLIGFFARRPWGWRPYVGWFFGLFLVLGMMSAAGQRV
jgi:hypothetical protein